MYIFICHQVCGVWCGVSELWRDPVLWGVETPHGCGGREGGREGHHQPVEPPPVSPCQHRTELDSKTCSPACTRHNHRQQTVQTTAGRTK